VHRRLVLLSFTSNLGVWYSGGTGRSIALVLAMTVHGFHAAMAGRLLAGDKFLDT